MSAGDPYIFNNHSLIGGTGINISSGGSWGTTISVDLLNNKEFTDLQNRMAALEKQLCILRANETLQEKYPALQEAYDAYQMILKMVQDQNRGSI